MQHTMERVGRLYDGATITCQTVYEVCVYVSLNDTSNLLLNCENKLSYIFCREVIRDRMKAISLNITCMYSKQSVFEGLCFLKQLMLCFRYSLKC